MAAQTQQSSGDLQRVSGIANMVVGADPMSREVMVALNEKLLAEAPCLRESVRIAGSEGLTVHVAQITAGAKEPGYFSLGVLHFLHAHINRRKAQDLYSLADNVNAEVFLRTGLQFLIDSPNDLSTRVLEVSGDRLPKMFADVCHLIAQIAVDLKACAAAINPLLKACYLLANGEPVLTPTHCEVVRLCLKTVQPTLAKELLNTRIEAINPKKTGLVTKDYLLYFYYGGLCYSALKEWESAVDFFTTCINTPADGLSSIVVEAHKYWCIVSLFLKNGPAPPESWKNSTSTPMAITNFLEPTNKLYVKLNKEFIEASIGKAGTEVKCNRFIAENIDEFKADNTIGLIQQATKWIFQRRIQRLTFTYITLSTSDIASIVGVEESTVPGAITNLVENGFIFASIDTTSNMVTFSDDPQRYTGQDSIAIMTEKMQKVNTLAQRVQHMKARVMTSEKYIEQSVLEDQRREASGNATSILSSNDVAMKTENMDELDDE